MLVYVILAAIVGYYALNETGKKSWKDKKAFNYCLLAFLLVVGLRYAHGDYMTYEMGFNTRTDIAGDKGYFFFQLLFERMGSNFQFFVFVITLVSVIAFKKTFDLGPWPIFGLVVLLGKFFTLYAMSGIRQYIAMAICWWAIRELLVNNRRVLFVAMVLFAYTLHGSAIIVLPILFIKNLRFSYTMMFVMIITSFGIGLASQRFFESLSDVSETFDSRFGVYLRDKTQEGMNVLNYIENFVILFLALRVREKARKLFVYYDFFLYLYIIYCGFLIVGSDVGVVKRLRDYYGIAYAFIVPFFMFLFNTRRNRRIVKVLFIVYFIFLMFRSLSVYDSAFLTGHYYRMVPYHSVIDLWLK